MTNRGTIAGRNNHTGRMTRSTRDGQEDDQVHYSGWLPAEDYAELVRAALDDGMPPDEKLAEVVHAWRVARETEAEMAAVVAQGRSSCP